MVRKPGCDLGVDTPRNWVYGIPSFIIISLPEPKPQQRVFLHNYKGAVQHPTRGWVYILLGGFHICLCMCYLLGSLTSSEDGNCGLVKGIIIIVMMGSWGWVQRHSMWAVFYPTNKGAESQLLRRLRVKWSSLFFSLLPVQEFWWQKVISIVFLGSQSIPWCVDCLEKQSMTFFDR